MFGICLTYAADQPSHSDWTKAVQISTQNAKLFELVVANKSGTDFFVQVFDKASAPGGGDVPVYDLPVPQGSFLPFGWAGGRPFGNGIYVRCVTAQGGSTAIPGDDAKYTWNLMTGPLS